MGWVARFEANKDTLPKHPPQIFMDMHVSLISSIAPINHLFYKVKPVTCRGLLQSQDEHENKMRNKMAQLISQFENKGLMIEENESKIVKKLGHGASAKVYKADYQNEMVAVKMYNQTILTQDFVSCMNEMKFMCSLHHENIVQVKGLVLQESPPKAGVVMALAKKGELGDALYKSRKIRRGGSELKFKIATGMAKRLKYLHSWNVIYRDIKPENVLLGENGEALWTDFGYSRYIDYSVCMTGETGSYRYMAPEVIRSVKYSEKADVLYFRGQ